MGRGEVGGGFQRRYKAQRFSSLSPCNDNKPRRRHYPNEKRIAFEYDEKCFVCRREISEILVIANVRKYRTLSQVAHTHRHLVAVFFILFLFFSIGERNGEKKIINRQSGEQYFYTKSR